MSFPSSSQDAQSSLSLESIQPCRHFTFSEIQLATHDFDESLVIGRGGFGKVYKGTISNGSSRVDAAIKRLESTSNQGAVEFWAEVEMLSKLRHCHLVSLIGYCKVGQEMILLYEYMPRGTLEDHLHKHQNSLSWVRRLKICTGAARGLDYLHTGTGIKHGVIHRDVKSSNILLDNSWAAKISDFGLSKIGPTNQPSTYVNTMVRGTFGYLDPNYFYTGKLTRKSDVYAFGVVLFEVLCGKKAVDISIDEEQCGLAVWAHDSVKEGMVNQIVDLNLRGRVSSKCLKEFARLADRCLHSSPKQRPTMAQVVAGLESVLASEKKTSNLLPTMDMKIFGKMIPMSFFQSRRENSDISQTTNTSNTTNSLSSGTSSKIGPGGHILSHPNLRLFTFAELRIATRNFRSDTVLGEGGFGKVYKGLLEDKATSKTTVIAVKKPNSESVQGLGEWQSEVEFLGRLSHPNLVKLLGYCYEGTVPLLLVYEFMQKGSLENHLFGRGSTVQPLPWDIRLKISIGAARGLAFLHASVKQIIYTDFKSSKILLDGSYNAKLSDFGLARIDPSASQSHVTTRVMGTYGYAAPEYVSIGHLYVKSDVYGFGVVLVEMLTGLRALDATRPAEQNLTDWIKPFLADGRKLEKVMDSRLEGRYPSKATSQIAQLASTCLGPEPKSRPSMKEIVEKLEQLDAINERPKVPTVRHSSHPSPYRHSQQPSQQRRSPSPHATPEGNRRTKRSPK